jgi:cytochrome c556
MHARAKHNTRAATLSALICSLSMAVGAAAAEEPAAAVVEARQAGFKKMGAALKAITEKLKSESPDVPALTAPSQAISVGAAELARWFPAGSGAESGVDTDALSNIWTDRSKFDSLATELIAEAKSLSAAMATNDATAIRAQAKRVGSVCSTCHRSFRAD